MRLRLCRRADSITVPNDPASLGLTEPAAAFVVLNGEHTRQPRARCAATSGHVRLRPVGVVILPR